MLTGVVPYDGTTTASVIKKHVTEPFPSPQEKNPAISDACATLLETMMAKQRENRYQTWDDLVVDIERVASGMTPFTAPSEPRVRGEAVNKVLEPHVTEPYHPDSGANPKWSFVKAVAGLTVVIIAILWLFPSNKAPSLSVDIHQASTASSSAQAASIEPFPVTSPLFKKKKMPLAVLPFANQSADPNFKGPAESCSEAMILPLSKISKINLVERMQLNKVIQEIDLSQTSYVDPEYAIKIGKMLGVDASIMGGLQKIGDTIRITVRVVSSETGKIIYSEHVDGDFDDFFDVQDKLAESLAEKFE